MKTPRRIRDLTADPRNRRTHTPRNVEMIAASLREVGAGRSIVIDEDNTVLAGNGVLEGAAAAGLTKVQVVETDGDTIIAVRRRGLSDVQKRALSIFDNRTAELAEWNGAQLAADLQNGEDLSAFFLDAELRALVDVAPPAPAIAGRTDPDDVPQERATDIQAGDLFELGPHRLLCGDSASPDALARLMGDLRADLVFTSPPYGQQRDYTAGRPARGSRSNISVDGWQALMTGVFGNLPTKDATQVLVNLGVVHGDNEWIPYWDDWIAWMRGQGWRRFALYVWDQLHGLRGDWAGRLAPSYELVFHFNRQAVRPQKWVPSIHAGEKGGAMRNQDGSFPAVWDDEIQPFKVTDNVWRAQRQKGGIDGHPAPYSVAVCEIPIRSWPGLVYDPFAGSGTTMIAAHGLGQPSCNLEVAPTYCQVAIDRWEAFTGLKAVKVGGA